MAWVNDSHARSRSLNLHIPSVIFWVRTTCSHSSSAVSYDKRQGRISSGLSWRACFRSSHSDIAVRCRIRLYSRKYLKQGSLYPRMCRTISGGNSMVCMDTKAWDNFNFYKCRINSSTFMSRDFTSCSAMSLINGIRLDKIILVV